MSDDPNRTKAFARNAMLWRWEIAKELIASRPNMSAEQIITEAEKIYRWASSSEPTPDEPHGDYR